MVEHRYFNPIASGFNLYNKKNCISLLSNISNVSRENLVDGGEINALVLLTEIILMVSQSGRQ